MASFSSPAHESLSSLLHEVSAQTGVELRLDEEGVCGFVCEDGLSCGVTLLSGDRVGLFTPVATLRHDDREQQLTALLARNLFSLHPAGAALALDEDTDEVHFCLALNLAQLDATSFADLLGRFISSASSVRADLNSTPTPTAPASDPASVASPFIWSGLRA